MIKPECLLYGENFSPKKLLNIKNIYFKTKNEVGDIAPIGRYKDKPLPYGSCTLMVPKHIDIKNRIEWMADFIYENIDSFKESGATDITFSICWSGLQGNMELSVEELQKIAKLQIPLSMDYIYEKE